jgi:hypothetical protein
MSAFWKWIVSLFKKVPKPTPAPTPDPIPDPANGSFVLGAWTWIGRPPVPVKGVKVAPNAKCLSATVRGETIYPIFDPLAKTLQWWPPRDATTYGHQCCAWKESGKWWCALVETYPLAVRSSEEFKNPFKSDTPFQTGGHPFTRGCEAWWFVENEAGTLVSTPVKIIWG